MNCDRIITDNTCNIIVQNDPYSAEYVYVYILQWNPSNRNKARNQMVIKESIDQDIIFNIGEDGFYTLCTIPVPLDESKPYYYKDGFFYNQDGQVEIQDIVNTDPEETGINATYEYYFSTCWLRRCYIKYAQEILDSHNSSVCNSNNVDLNVIYKRDLIWSALNVIQYMIEFDQYEEAQRVLERIETCNGLCERSQTGGGSCGCGK